MKLAATFAILAVFIVVEVDAALTPVDDSTLSGFRDEFRAILLDIVAVEVNATVDKSNELKVEIEKCVPIINATRDACKACAQKACTPNPTFVDYLEAVGKLINPWTYLKKPLEDMAKQVSNVVTMLGTKAYPYLKSMKNMGESIFVAALDGLKKLWAGFLNALEQLGDRLKDILKTVLSIPDLLGDAFSGRKRRAAITYSRQRREIDPDVRACMEKCSNCAAFLLPTTDDMVTKLCGGTIVSMNHTIQAMVRKCEGIFNAAVDQVNPIVQSLLVDKTTLDLNTWIVSHVEINAFLNGVYTQYKTSVTYNLLNSGSNAKNMAVEYWSNAVY